jgi:choline dehydrogenase-like flavoprotein
MAADGGELTCNAECRLRATRAVYVADGSPFPYLPAKGLTFTIMANANRVGSLLAETLASGELK